MRAVKPLPSSKRILLVEPQFPIPAKSKNHKDFLPIGLLKIGAWLEDTGFQVKLVRGDKKEKSLKFLPDEVWITSLFTYWSKYVIESARHYRAFSNKPRIVVGGIYASLMKEHCKEKTGADVVFKGVHSEAEQYYPAYHLLRKRLDYRIVHASRGCIHKCKFCGVHIIEPNGFKSECSILPLITKPASGRRRACGSDLRLDDCAAERKKLVFYDNNLLANENIDDILRELAHLKKEKKIAWCESQSGFDGRVLQARPHLAPMLKEAGFRNPRIAWDWGLKQGASIKTQIDLLNEAGYSSKEIYVFMIYNWGIPFEEMEEKRILCFDWGVQISDCRYRPLTATDDCYDPRTKSQLTGYHIHSNAGWTDALVRQFRMNVRRQNICIRHGFPLYCKEFETKNASEKEVRSFKEAQTVDEKKEFLEVLRYHYWDPQKVTSSVDNGTSQSRRTIPLVYA